jgi:hypothetical protein
MSTLYGTSHIASIEEAASSDALLEAYLVDDIMHGSEEQIKQFCESEEAKILVEKAVLKKPTLIRLSASADFKRRVKLTAYQLAKDNKDPNWAKLVKYQGLKKQYAQKILTKYGKKAERIAKLQQKAYIKNAKKAVANDK